MLKIADRLPKTKVIADELMSEHTSFRVGGTADLFVEITSEDELKCVIKILNLEGLTLSNGGFCVIGSGSNILVSDKGLRRVVIHMSKEFGRITVRKDTLTCDAGASIASIARCALDNSLTGFEFAAGIPGSLGGAIVMNAGAYDGEMKQVVESVRLMDENGEIVKKSAEEMKFSYRHSILKEKDYIVLSADIHLAAGTADDIKAKMQELADRRRDKQPLEYPSAGSTFKRPEGYFAAKLIQDAGLRGFSIGAAQVSEKHCGFVINRGGAKASDIYSLIGAIQKKVNEVYGVMLEPEVICLGEFE